MLLRFNRLPGFFGHYSFATAFYVKPKVLMTVVPNLPI